MATRGEFSTKPLVDNSDVRIKDTVFKEDVTNTNTLGQQHVTYH